MVPEDKLPGEMRGRDVKRIKFEINKTHLEGRNELRSRKGRRRVDVASSNWGRLKAGDAQTGGALQPLTQV